MGWEAQYTYPHDKYEIYYDIDNDVQVIYIWHFRPGDSFMKLHTHRTDNDEMLTSDEMDNEKYKIYSEVMEGTRLIRLLKWGF